MDLVRSYHSQRSGESLGNHEQMETEEYEKVRTRAPKNCHLVSHPNLTTQFQSSASVRVNPSRKAKDEFNSWSYYGTLGC